MPVTSQSWRLTLASPLIDLAFEGPRLREVSINSQDSSKFRFTVQSFGARNICDRGKCGPQRGPRCGAEIRSPSSSRHRGLFAQCERTSSHFFIWLPKRNPVRTPGAALTTKKARSPRRGVRLGLGRERMGPTMSRPSGTCAKAPIAPAIGASLFQAHASHGSFPVWLPESLIFTAGAQAVPKR